MKYSYWITNKKSAIDLFKGSTVVVATLLSVMGVEGTLRFLSSLGVKGGMTLAITPLVIAAVKWATNHIKNAPGPLDLDNIEPD